MCEELRVEIKRLQAENAQLEKSIAWLISKRFGCPCDGSPCGREVAFRRGERAPDDVCKRHWREAARSAGQASAD